jgi:hypothetical protein
MGLIAVTTEFWVVAATAAVIVVFLILPALVIAHFVLASFNSEGSYDRSVAQVQRFIDLTERSRAAMRSSPHLPLFNADAAIATAEAIDRARRVKDEARMQLWSHELGRNRK